MRIDAPVYLGIDLTSTESKPTACAVLAADCSLLWLGFQGPDADIVSLAVRHAPSLVAIDAPLGFPRGMDCLEEGHPCRSQWPFNGRKADREIIDRSMSIYVITKRTFIKKMVYRAIRLAENLRAHGLEVIEVYPYASKVRLFGKNIPKKSTREGREFLRTSLEPLVGELDRHPPKPNHDLYDAVIAAYTAYLHRLGKTETVGLAEEGQIVLPRAA